MGLPTMEEVYGPNPTGDPMRRTEYLYDERFRVKQQDVKWFEHVGGVNSNLGDGSVTTIYQYDAEDQLRFETNDKDAVTEYQYDAAGRKQALIYPQTAELPPGTQNKDSWTYDGNGNVKTLTLEACGIQDGDSTPTQRPPIRNDGTTPLETSSGSCSPERASRLARCSQSIPLGGWSRSKRGTRAVL